MLYNYKPCQSDYGNLNKFSLVLLIFSNNQAWEEGGNKINYRKLGPTHSGNTCSNNTMKEKVQADPSLEPITVHWYIGPAQRHCCQIAENSAILLRMCGETKQIWRKCDIKFRKSSKKVQHNLESKQWNNLLPYLSHGIFRKIDENILLTQYWNINWEWNCFTK